jgi:pyruvate ferredoxin oxidoreductase alpha subunit
MPEHAQQVIEELQKIAKTGKVKILKEYIGVRE